jgi:hypothetical protein
MGWNVTPMNEDITLPDEDNTGAYSGDIIARWRNTFNRIALGLNEEGERVYKPTWLPKNKRPADYDPESPSPAFDEDSAPKNTKLLYTRERINVLIDVIKHTDSGDVEERLKMKNEQGFKNEVNNLHHKFYPWTFPTTDNDSVTMLYRKEPGRKDGDRLVCPIEEIFDKIRNIHTHSRGRKTFERVSSVYWNITHALCDCFVELCPICCMKNPPKNKRVGARCPIISGHFRDRFQVDLIDYSMDKRRDHNGVLMSYLLVVKDHFTQFVWTKPLPRKEPKCIAMELEHFFSFFGYPQIFHTDNGPEFIAQLVFEALKEIDPNMFSVLGRPRNPSDQGSVERTNRTVKDKTEAFVQEALALGDKEASWVTVQGRVMRDLNTTIIRIDGESSTPYKLVFGLDYEMEMKNVPRDVLRNMMTVSDRVNVKPNDIRFIEMAKEFSYITNEDDPQDDNGNIVLEE